MSADPETKNVEVQVTEHVFGNSPSMLALCLTTVGLLKIYSALQRITTFADDLLLICLAAFLLSTVISYLALRSSGSKRKKLAKIADYLFLSGLTFATVVAVFIVFTLAG